jgi:hypothetical protein
VIKYLLNTELFAIQKSAIRGISFSDFPVTIGWTTFDRKSSCKNFFDLYNATPLAGSDELKLKR